MPDRMSWMAVDLFDSLQISPLQTADCSGQGPSAKVICARPSSLQARQRTERSHFWDVSVGTLSWRRCAVPLAALHRQHACWAGSSLPGSTDRLSHAGPSALAERQSWYPRSPQLLHYATVLHEHTQITAGLLLHLVVLHEVEALLCCWQPATVCLSFCAGRPNLS